MMYLSELNNVLNGIIKNDALFNKIKTNSKEIEEGDLFLAINSGHNYIEEAINNGSSCIISEKELDNVPNIKIDNSIEALGKIGNLIRNKYKIPLIAVTGSVGKTTTKELISLILGTKYNVLKSEKNHNNNIGLPMTLLNLNEKYDVIVTELGMNHFGEISYLSKICNPDYAVITNIGSAHIGNLGSKKNIMKAKLEILDGMNDGYLLINKKDKYLKNIKYKNIIKVDDKLLNVKNIKYNDNIEFDIDNIHFMFKSYKHILPDLFIAIKIGLIFGIDLKTMSEVIKEYNGIDGRLNIIKNKYTIIDDSYNSSFESLVGGLNLLKGNELKFIVLGDMLELGKYSKIYHKKINKYLKKIKNKKVLLLGEYTKNIKGIHFDTIEEIIIYLKENIKDDCIIYLKGSRKMNLDKIKNTL